MGLGELVGKIRQRESIEYASFPIPGDRVVLTPDAASIATYTPWETYFEVRMTQMHLRNQGEYWRDFLPLGSILLEFTFEGKQQTVPVVVGPDRLKQAQKFEKDDRVSYFNVRVAGPYPYEGDDVSLFVGLFRMQTHDWAKQALGLLENVAEAFDTTRLTSFLDISGPIVGGIEAFLDMDDIEFRVGDQRSFVSTPTPSVTASSGSPAFNVFAPRYIVYIRVRSTELSDQQRTRFWVKDGRLTTGTTAGDLEDEHVWLGVDAIHICGVTQLRLGIPDEEQRAVSLSAEEDMRVSVGYDSLPAAETRCTPRPGKIVLVGEIFAHDFKGACWLG